MKRMDVQQAWNKKLVLNLLIWFICACAVFVAVIRTRKTITGFDTTNACFYNSSVNMKLFITVFWCQRDERFKGKISQSPDANDWMMDRGRLRSEILLREMILIVKSDLRVSY